MKLQTKFILWVSAVIVIIMTAGGLWFYQHQHFVDGMRDLAKMELARNVALWVGCLTAATVLAVSMLARVLVSMPVRQMGRKMAAIAENRAYRERLEEATRQDELGMPARAFNQLLNEVSEHVDALRSVNENLEKRVEERTAQITRSNLELAATRHIALDCIITMDHEGMIASFNAAAERTFGYRSEAVVGKSLAEMIIPVTYREQHKRGLMNFLKKGTGPLIGKRIEMSALRSDGQEFPVKLSVSAVNIKGVPHFTAYLRDITAQKREQELDKDRRLVLEMMAERRPLEEILTQLVLMFERQNHHTAAAAMLLVHSKFHHIASPSLPVGVRASLETLPVLPAPFDRCNPQESANILEADIRTDASWQPLREEAAKWGLVRCRATPLISSSGELIGAFAIYFREGGPEDVDKTVLEMVRRKAAIAIEQRNLADQLAHQARYDTITGLPNRVMLDDRLQQAVARSRRDELPVGLLLIDIDRFKVVNDTLGHKAGDLLLLRIAQRLGVALREADTLSRIEGDEFAVVLPGMGDSEAAARVAGRLLELLKEPFIIEGREIFIGASVGISIFPQDGSDSVTLQKAADTALHMAKSAGRGQFRMFAPEMNAAALERLNMETNLRRAVESKELGAAYQPKVDREGKMVGIEALLRWTHPTLGLVSPAKFIPLAEECGLIVPMGMWILNEACRQARAWQKAGLRPVPVAVNVSMLQFAQPNFATFVAETLRQHELDPQWLELEVTESLLLHDAAATAAKLEAIRDLGVGVALDDFGTGYSSLAYLQKLPIDTLKIDRSFVSAISEQTTVIRAILSLAHSLGMKVVAEGVETVAQREFLLSIGCNEMQGFFFSKPVSPDEIEQLMRCEQPLGGALLPWAKSA
ncbi:MAG TPA: EAL domain-containing protein [Tepidisphaeraceae bacterium]|nr:EAL domain-containing protein [Tepidisphaeraceae bacterium]